MSQEEAQTQEIAQDEAGVPHEGSSSTLIDKILPSGSGGSIFLFFVIGLLASLAFGWIIFPKLLYSQKKQPIDFNHALHVAAVDNGCESCHYFREDGTFSGIPRLEDCRVCHEEPIGVSDKEQHFFTEYVLKDKEVPWLVYARQPDCVFFSHIAHVQMGSMDCKTCHGPVGESDHTRVYQQNRITGYSRDIWGGNIAGFKRNSWDRMKMNDCAECHARAPTRQGSVQTEKDGCFVCHK